MAHQQIARYRIPKGISKTPTNSVPTQVRADLLYAQRDTLATYPLFQRKGSLWPARYKYDFMVAVATGAYIPPIVKCSRLELDGVAADWIIDGQQRLRTLMEYIEALYAYKQGIRIPVDPLTRRPYFFFPPEEYEYAILNYQVQFASILNPTYKMINRIYLGLQNHVAATAAEKLWAMDSSAADITRETYVRSSFIQGYAGRDNRMQKYQFSAFPTLIEMGAPFLDMNVQHMQFYIRGERDSLIIHRKDALIENVLYNLEQAERLFKGVEIKTLNEMIILYQAIWLLRFIGCDLAKTPTGALKDWYEYYPQNENDSRANGYIGLFSRFINQKTQKESWANWLPQIVYGSMVAGATDVAVLAQFKRVMGWLQFKGVCPNCKQPGALTEVKTHRFYEGDTFRPGTCSAAVPSIEVKPAVLLYT